jgi:hypothetical protein
MWDRKISKSIMAPISPIVGYGNGVADVTNRIV